MQKQTLNLYNWFDERFALGAIKEAAAKKKVPVHKHSIWYYMGGIALMLLMIQFVTGILLMFYYIPEISSAYSSVLKINSQIDFGWFFRSMHSWGANIMVAVLFIHMFSTYFMGAYRKPRELTWLTGLGLLVLCLAFGFTGYLLPWDEVAFFATKIGLDITAELPIIGQLLADTLRGGLEVGQGTLSRFFVIHVVILPLSLLLLLFIHLMMVQMHGMSEPRKIKKMKYEPFFPDFFVKDLMVWLLTLNVLATIVILSPWGIGEQADPFQPAPIGIKPEWYFLGMFQFLKILPAHIGFIEGEKLGLFIFVFIGFVFAIAPFVDAEDKPVMNKLFQLFGILVLVALVIFTVWGLIA